MEGTGLLLLPGHVDVYRHLVLNRNCEQRWRVDLEVGKGCWNRPNKVGLVAGGGDLKADLLVMSRVSGEFDIKIGGDGSSDRGRFRQLRADADHRELRTASGLEHVKVAV